jgi:hypothetical protein
MNDLNTIGRNAMAGLLTALVATSAAYALWLGAPLLNSTVGAVFATDIPVVRLSHPPVSPAGTPIDYSAVVAASRNLVMNPKAVPQLPAAAPAAHLVRVRTATPAASAPRSAQAPVAANAPLAAKKSKATSPPVQRVAASRSEASTAVQNRQRDGSSGEHRTSADSHRGAGTQHHSEASQSQEH